MGLLARLVLVPALVLACGCSSTPKEEAKTPDEGAMGESSGDAPQAASGGETSVEPGPSAAPTGVKVTGIERNDDGSIPDDYTLVERDCVQLGDKLGLLWRADLRATLSPKLSEKQRAQAEESIQEGATKKADDWANGCIKSLVGKSVDPKALKCAFDSRDLKVFEKCLN